MVYNSVLFDSPKTPCLRKIWFLKYGLKCSQPIRLQYSLINVFGRNPAISYFFLNGDSHQAKVASGTIFFCWVCQLCLSSIQILGFCDHQCLGKELSDILVFLHKVSHQGKAVSDTIFGRVWPVVPPEVNWLPLEILIIKESCNLSNQIARFFDHQYLWKGLIDLLHFLHGGDYQEKVASDATIFGWVWSVVPFILSDCRIL